MTLATDAHHIAARCADCGSAGRSVRLSTNSIGLPAFAQSTTKCRFQHRARPARHSALVAVLCCETFATSRFDITRQLAHGIARNGPPRTAFVGGRGGFDGANEFEPAALTLLPQRERFL